MSFLDSPIDHAISWLEALYASSPAGAWVNLCMRSGSHVALEWAQVGQLAGLRQAIGNFSERGDVYFSVATRKHKLEGERGGAADCLGLPALFCDVDIDDGTGAHSLEQLPRHESEALSLIRRFPLLPSAVIWSGHGLQPFWLLAEPLEAAEASVMLARWQLTWQEYATEAGFHLDNVSDLPRMMRLPGTPNRKGPEPVLAYYKADPRRIWQPSDLDECLLPIPEATERPKSYTKHLAGSRFNEEVSCAEVLTWAGAEQIAPLPGEEYASHWHWPGASHEKSFTVFPDGGCACWSETCAAQTGIPLRKSLDPFGLYTWLNHRGDFAAASAHLVRVGWPEAGTARSKAQASVSLTLPLSVSVAAHATPETVEWLWRPWLPLGKLVTVDGDPATGKSSMLVDLASRVTRGGLMPDGSECGATGAVILLAAEDDLADTVLWRLMAAGADLTAVHYVRHAHTADGQGRPVSLPLDVPALEQLVQATSARLVIVDVLYEYLDSGVDSYRDPAVRQALHILAAMAERTNVCVALVRHITKGATGGKAIHAGGGSIGVIGRARVGLMVGYHPDVDGLRVLAPVKSNLAEMPKPLGFRLEPHDVYPCAQLRWSGPVDTSANQLLGGPKAGPVAALEPAIVRCVEALRSVLSYEWQWTDEVMEALEPLGFTQNVIRKGLDFLQVEHKQFGPDATSGHYRGWKIRLRIEEE